MQPKRRVSIIETLAKSVEQVGPEFERFVSLVPGALSDVRRTQVGVNLRSHPIQKMSVCGQLPKSMGAFQSV